MIRGYDGPELFCDRRKEVAMLLSNVENKADTTLFSLRRMGKTGLLHHVHHLLQAEKKLEFIYVDIYSTNSLTEFTNEVASAVLKAFPEKIPIGKRFMSFLKSLNPTISYDQFIGTPEVKLTYTQQENTDYSLSQLFSFLDRQGMRIVVALDEFQQILNYPEKNTEALLRSIVQSLKNVVFIYSGSQNHLLAEMFTSAKRPFYSSSRSLHLDSIDEGIYIEFIENHLRNSGFQIENEIAREILSWTFGHTYYTQALCHRIFAMGKRKVTREVVLNALITLLDDESATYFQYRKLLTSNQWRVLVAIAKEVRVFEPTSAKFIREHQLPGQSSVQRAIETLGKQEMIITIIDETNEYLRLSDVFLMRWLARTY